jgi:hypothetical protein
VTASPTPQSNQEVIDVKAAQKQKRISLTILSSPSGSSFCDRRRLGFLGFLTAERRFAFVDSGIVSESAGAWCQKYR